MSDVSTLKSDIISKIDAITTATVAKWAGEDVAFSATKPGIYVQWLGEAEGDNEEIGGILYISDHIFVVFVATEDSETTDGDDAAATLLEAVRGALHSKSISTFGYAQPYSGHFPGGLTTMLIGVHAGAYLYGQAWRIEQIKG
jgi:phage gp37-like protein